MKIIVHYRRNVFERLTFCNTHDEKSVERFRRYGLVYISQCLSTAASIL